MVGIIFTKLLDTAWRASVYPGDCGSSGMVARNESSSFLNSGSSTPDMFRIRLGNKLNNLAPLMHKLPSRREFMRVEAVLEMDGITQSLPLRVDVVVFT